MPKTITINLNDFVKVKLTDVGKDIYYHQNDELNEAIRQRGGRPVEARMPKVDEDGYTSFQLHDLMTLYGPHIAVWKQLPFATNMLYEVQCKEPPTKPLTWEEAITDDFYLEQRGDEYVDMALNTLAMSTDVPEPGLSDCIHFVTHSEEDVKLMRADYGKTWRCWPRRPTDEERRAAAWIS